MEDAKEEGEYAGLVKKGGAVAGEYSDFTDYISTFIDYGDQPIKERNKETERQGIAWKCCAFYLEKNLSFWHCEYNSLQKTAFFV